MLRVVLSYCWPIFLLLFSACNQNAQPAPSPASPGKTSPDKPIQVQPPAGKPTLAQPVITDPTVVMPSVALAKANIAGVDVEKFDYPASKKLSNDDFESLTNDLREATKNFKDSDQIKSIKDIGTAVSKLDARDINLLDDDGTSILLTFANDFFPKIGSLTKWNFIKTSVIDEIISRFLEKGAHPDQKASSGKTAKESLKLKLRRSVDKMAEGDLDQILSFYEPSKSVKEALKAIIVSLFANNDFDVTGKKAVSDLKLLEPYFSSPDTKNLVAAIVQNFSNLNFDEDKLRAATKQHALSGVSFMLNRIGQNKNLPPQISQASLQVALGLLMSLSGMDKREFLVNSK